MKPMGLNEIREAFLSFFESKDHLRLPSFSLVPKNDPSILLINAGMTPLKPYFTGAEIPPSKRVTTCQKCIRTPDIDRVGQTARHGTFFEMLGNFSFGDYFKKEIIPWAWEFCTEVLQMPEDRLYVTVFLDDDEAYDIWHRDVGLASEKIFRFGKEDNFWEHGTGPCGPCSEIFFDRGEKYGCGDPECTVGCECDRFIEIWNLVFTQFDRDDQGAYTPLKNKNIDTGAGLERFASVMQGVDNLFEVDTIRAILDEVCRLADVEYGQDEQTDIAIRVITDHIRSTTFMISDGIEPSNERRGYVLRRLIRRAARYGRKLGINEPFLSDLAEVVMRESETAYPELGQGRERILRVIRLEEETFARTIQQGTQLLERSIAETKLQGKRELAGEEVFKLHDTYGFPVDLTREIAAENGLTIDQASFDRLMKEQKERARQATLARTGSAWDANALPETVDRSKPTVFTGYERFSDQATVLELLQLGEHGLQAVDLVEAGDPVFVITDRSPFYAEAGGQIGDVGVMENERGLRIEIEQTSKSGDGIYLHQGVVRSGQVERGDALTLRVARDIRLATARNHTGTHLLHHALRLVLGEHVEQAGSFVSAARLRFDFKHHQPVNRAQMAEIEDWVNREILRDSAVTVKEMSQDEAIAQGAMALFGEKYGDVVRVVSVGDSVELCGGTHLEHASQIGSFRLIGESGIAAGIRRIEAVTGEEAYHLTQKEHQLLLETACLLKTQADELPQKAEQLLSEQRRLRKELANAQGEQASGLAARLAGQAETLGQLHVVISQVELADADQLRQTGDQIRDHLDHGVVVLASPQNGKVLWLIMATASAVKQGVHAGNLVREAAKITGGGGGGRPDMAQAGGRDASRIEEAFATIRDLLSNG